MISNAYQLQAKFTEKIENRLLSKFTPVKMKRALEKGAVIVRDEAIKRAPVGNPNDDNFSGQLKNSIVYFIKNDTGKMYAEIGPHVKSPAGFNYALSVEFGRKGFSAKNGGVLVFKKGGKLVFAKRVGPAKAKPFLLPALLNNKKLIFETMAKELNK